MGDQIYARYSFGARALQEFMMRCDSCFHIFHCPLYVFIETSWSLALGTFGPTDPRTLADVYKWKHWTTGSCEFIAVPESDHYSIRFHPEVELKLWQEFLRLSGVSDIV